MSLYQRGDIWWYKFKFSGVTIRESSGLTSWSQARDVEAKRRLELKEGRAGIVKRKGPVIFSTAADSWLLAKRSSGDWQPKTEVIEKTNLGHLNDFFGTYLLTDIEHPEVAKYWDGRKRKQAADKTISLELGTLRSILLYHDRDSQWAAIRRKVELKQAADVAKKLTADEELCLLQECSHSRSRSLPIIVRLALQTGMRSSELRLMQWRQVDFDSRIIVVGKSKTAAGTGREIPMSSSVYQALEFWAASFPKRKPNHFVFPAEKYGAAGDEFKPKTYNTDPTRPIATFKEAWEAAKERAGVDCRFHDLRATACQRLRDAGVAFPLIGAIMGWSSATTILMTKRYGGDVGQDAKRGAIGQMEVLSQKLLEGAQKRAQMQEDENAAIQ